MLFALPAFTRIVHGFATGGRAAGDPAQVRRCLNCGCADRTHRSSLLGSLFKRKDKDATLTRGKSVTDAPVFFDAALLGQDFVISTGDEGHAKSTMATVRVSIMWRCNNADRCSSCRAGRGSP